MQAIVVENGQLAFEEDRPEAALAKGEVSIRPIQAGICETDLQLIQGYMGFSGVLGHEFVGIAESGCFAGQRVVCEINCICERCEYCAAGLGNHCPSRTVIGILNHDGAFAERLSAPERNLHAVPDDISDDLATLVEPAAAALQICEQVELEAGQRAIVLGDGRLGNLCAQVLRDHGCDVLVIGKHQPKLDRLRAIGLQTALLADVSAERTADLVVDCTGSPTGLDLALSVVRPCGVIVLKTTVAVPHHLSLAPAVIDEITLIGSRCGPFDKALQALQDGVFELSDFIVARYPLRSFAAAFEHARSPQALKVVFEIQ